MKIVHFNAGLKKEDGVVKVIFYLISEAKIRGHQSMIVTGWLEDVSNSPAPVVEVPAIVFPLNKAYRLPLPGQKGFAKTLDQFKPDVIHIHSPETIGHAALKYAKARNIPVLATYHTNFALYASYYHLGALQPFLWWLLRRFYNKMDAVTGTSTVTTDDITGHGIKNVQTISWGVDLNRFNSSFRSESWRNDIFKRAAKKNSLIENSGVGAAKFILLSVCRLTPEKDVTTLAAAYNILRKQRNDFVMVLLGEGPERKYLEEIMPGAVFLGHVEFEVINEAYASSDILFFPSANETFGMVTLEAMACGIIPVVANAGGSKALVQNGKTGFLAEPTNAKDFALKLAKLLDDPELLKEMRQQITKYVQQFSWEKVSNHFLELYTKLVHDSQRN